MTPTTILAIDPGNIESALVLINLPDCRPIVAFKRENRDVLRYLYGGTYAEVHPQQTVAFAIEQIESFGMSVAHSVFETAHWAGRFQQVLEHYSERPHGEDVVHLITRKTVKRAVCGNIHAKDPNITQALIDRFAPNTPNKGKGSKANPGWFYGFAGDIWAAYAVAVTLADQLAEAAA